MKTIKRCEVEAEIKRLKSFLEDKSVMCNKVTNVLEEDGYTYFNLGYGKSVYICSKEIKIIHPHANSEYLHSRDYLAIGLYNRNFMYRGYLKAIVD